MSRRSCGQAKADASRSSRTRPGGTIRVYRVLSGPNRGDHWIRPGDRAVDAMGGARVECVAAFRDGKELAEVARA